MKLFKATIESINSCYVKTLLVTAASKHDAHNLIVESKKGKYTQNPRVVYKSELKEININLEMPGILEVGFSSNDSDFGSLDD